MANENQPTSVNRSSAESRADKVRALRLPQGGAGTARRGSLGWFFCIVLVAVIVWLTMRERAIRAKFEQILASGEYVTAGSAPESPASNGNPGGAPAERTSSQAPTAASVGEIALESKGYVIPAHQILVSPQVSGRLLRLFVEEGVRVTKGDVLGEIETTEYESDANRSMAQLARARATLELNKARLLELNNGSRPEEIEQAKAELAESQAQLAQLEAEWKRNKLLVPAKVITQQDFEVIESKYLAQQQRVEKLAAALSLAELGPRRERIESARAEVGQAEAEVQLAAAELIKAQWRLDNCKILAPISGTILKKNAEEGNIVNPIAFNGSFSVCDLADLSDLEVSLDIQERDISRVFKGQRCKIRAEAFPDRVYEGVVSRLMPIADRAKGSIPVRVKLSVPADEEGVYLKPEMGAVVSFLSAKGADQKGVAQRD